MLMLLSNTHINNLDPATKTETWLRNLEEYQTPSKLMYSLNQTCIFCLFNFWTTTIQGKRGLHTGIEHPFLLIFTELLSMFETFSLENPLMSHIAVAQVEAQLQQGLLHQALPIFTSYQDAKNYTVHLTAGPFMADWGLKPGLKCQFPARAPKPACSKIRSSTSCQRGRSSLLRRARDQLCVSLEGGRVHPNHICAFRAATALVAEQPTALLAQPGATGAVCFYCL